MVRVRLFETKDAEQLISIIKGNLLNINADDYGYERMLRLSETFTVQKILTQTSIGHTYVASLDKTDKVVACATIAPYWSSLNESILLTVFVDEAYHHQGIGRLLFDSIFQDEYYQRARRVEVPSSLHAEKFYLKMGFSYKGGNRSLNDEGYIPMERYNS